MLVEGGKERVLVDSGKERVLVDSGEERVLVDGGKKERVLVEVGGGNKVSIYSKSI